MEKKTYWTSWYDTDVLCVQGLEELYHGGTDNPCGGGACGILKEFDDVYGLYFTFRHDSNGDGVVQIDFIPVLDKDGNHVLLQGVGECYMVDSLNVNGCELRETPYALLEILYRSSCPTCIIRL